MDFEDILKYFRVSMPKKYLEEEEYKKLINSALGFRVRDLLFILGKLFWAYTFIQVPGVSFLKGLICHQYYRACLSDEYLSNHRISHRDYLYNPSRGIVQCHRRSVGWGTWVSWGNCGVRCGVCVRHLGVENNHARLILRRKTEGQ